LGLLINLSCHAFILDMDQITIFITELSLLILKRFSHIWVKFFRLCLLFRQNFTFLYHLSQDRFLFLSLL
jgi:hypothetical protein